MKLSVNKAKLTGLWARNCATIQLVLILKFTFAPEKLSGLSRNGPAPGLKTGVENDRFFSLKHGQDLENQAAHPHQEFPGGVPRAPMLPDRQWSATQLTSKSDYFIWRKVKWKGKIFAVSVEINSDKDQKETRGE